MIVSLLVGKEAVCLPLFHCGKTHMIQCLPFQSFLDVQLSSIQYICIAL